MPRARAVHTALLDDGKGTPGANMPDKGILYNPDAARRAWIATENFFKEICD